MSPFEPNFIYVICSAHRKCPLTYLPLHELPFTIQNPPCVSLTITLRTTYDIYIIAKV